MRTGRQILKRGFTLVETVVTVGIIGALAAVVYPTVVKQFDSADPTRAAEDLGNIRTGIEAFSINVRPHQPKDLEDLANAINTTQISSDSAATGALYLLADSSAWLGPYLGASIATTTGQDAIVFSTGFGGSILNRLFHFDADVANGGDTTVTVAGSEFLAIRIKGLSAAGFNAINALVDGPSETSTTLRRHSGRFRCPGNAAPADTACNRGAVYLAVATR